MFRQKQSQFFFLIYDPEEEGATFLWHMRYSITQRHITEDLNLQQHHCENLLHILCMLYYYIPYLTEL